MLLSVYLDFYCGLQTQFKGNNVCKEMEISRSKKSRMYSVVVFNTQSHRIDCIDLAGEKDPRVTPSLHWHCTAS